jgi:hypothetical protein
LISVVKKSEAGEMAKRRVVKREKRGVPEYTVLGCPLTKSHALWCHGLCVPEDGIGLCGRIAPHTVTGRTQMAILKHKIRQREAQRNSAKL